MSKTGLYLVGARGQVASTVAVGAICLSRGLMGSTGLLTATKPFQRLGLISWHDLVLGGVDIRPTPLFTVAEAVRRTAGLMPLPEAVSESLASVNEEIDSGTAVGCGRAVRDLAEGESLSDTLSLQETVCRIREKISAFRRRHDLSRVVVVNLASTEPPIHLNPAHAGLDALEEALVNNDRDLVRASTLYTYAALQEHCAYINFTPSNAALTPALVDLARKRGLPVMGNDGKTGETLVKSALAPLFSIRNLRVLTWQGYNMLGNMDGRVLSHEENKESKRRSKDRGLSRILGYHPHAPVGIDYVPSLGDQKTAWDFIHFEGFLGARMSVQVTWQGFDSILAAPLVLDMARLADLALRRGERGLMPHLACFFKDPQGVRVHGLVDQYRMLMDYATRVNAEKDPDRKVVSLAKEK